MLKRLSVFHILLTAVSIAVLSMLVAWASSSRTPLYDAERLLHDLVAPPARDFPGGKTPR